MLTRSAMLATTLTVGLVAGVGSSALAAAFVPGNESGTTQHVQAIADGSQDPSEGSSSSFLNGVPTIVTLPSIDIDGQSDERTPDAATEKALDPSASDSAKTAEDKAAEEQAKKDQKAAEEQAKKDQKAAEEQAKKDQKAAEQAKKAAAEQAKKDRKAAEQALKDQAKEDKAAEKDAENSTEETDENSPEAT